MPNPSLPLSWGLGRLESSKWEAVPEGPLQAYPYPCPCALRIEGPPMLHSWLYLYP